MIIMNLTVATVIEGLETARKKNSGVVQSDDIAKFVELWSDYDPNGTGWLSIENLIFLLYDLPPPFKFKKEIKYSFNLKE